MNWESRIGKKLSRIGWRIKSRGTENKRLTHDWFVHNFTKTYSCNTTQHGYICASDCMLGKRPIQVVKQMFHQGHLYQASFPPVKFQMPAPNANSVYSPKQTAQITAIKFLSPVKHLVAQVIVALVVEQGLSTVSTLPICPSECHASCHELCPMHRYKWSFFIFHISLSKPLKDCM